MRETFMGCSYSEIWAAPSNWKTTTAKSLLRKSWYVQCYFFDPAHAAQYPYGFPMRRKLNKLPTIAERREAIPILIEQLRKMLEVDGYNPITKSYMTGGKDGFVLGPSTNARLAILEAMGQMTGGKKHLTSARHAVTRICGIMHIRYPYLRISEVNYAAIYDLFEQAKLTPSSYNHYREFFTAIFKTLIKHGCCTHNWALMLDKKRIVRKKRTVLTDKEFYMVMATLKEKCPTFHRYAMIFFLSGSRTTELFSIRVKDVRLKEQEYDVLVQKARHPAIETKVILTEAVQYWKPLLSGARPGHYVFGRNLEPGKDQVNPRHINRRWKKYVKDGMGISADFYALKHKFLDMVDRKQNDGSFSESRISQALSAIDIPEEAKTALLKAIGSSPAFDVAQVMAAHKSRAMTDLVYKIGKESRERETLKGLRFGI